MKYLAIGFMGALLIALFITLFALMASSADGQQGGHGVCGVGETSIEGTRGEVTYDASPDIVTGVCIKAGNTQKHNQVYRNNGVILSSDWAQKCYAIKGIGTSEVTVTRLGEGNKCQGLSHIDVTLRPQETPTPTPTATPSPTPTPTPTPTETPTPTPTSTPTLTPTSTPLPTPTPDVTPAPTITPVAISAFQAPTALPNTGGEPAEDECREWTTGQAGDSSTPCSGGSGFADTLATIGILLLATGIASLAFWALFRRG